MRVVVIGAGVVGLAAASQLQLRGHSVTIVDPVPPGEACSFGNAGCLSRASCVPLGLPGVWKKVPGYLLDPAGPLSIPFGYAHRIAPWLWRFMRSTSPARVREIADALHALLDPTIVCWRPLAERAGVPELIRQDGYAFAYESEPAFLGDGTGRRIREEHGVRLEVIEGQAVREYEPSLAPTVTHLVVMPEQGHVPNPGRLSKALADRLRADGAAFVAAKAVGFESAGGRVRRVLAEGSALEADAVVIAGGARSNALSSQLGADVPLETERGYHVMLESPSVVPRIPVMSGEGKWFATPMEGGLRIAGTVELGGLDAPPNEKRAMAMLPAAQRLFPGLAYSKLTTWMGHRPSMPDSLPVIGPAPAASNAILAFGHGHVGLTAAAPTATIVADLIEGKSPSIDIRPYAPARF